MSGFDSSGARAPTATILTLTHTHTHSAVYYFLLRGPQDSVKNAQSGASIGSSSQTASTSSLGKQRLQRLPQASLQTYTTLKKPLMGQPHATFGCPR